MGMGVIIPWNTVKIYHATTDNHSADIDSLFLISSPQQSHSQAIEAAYYLVYSEQWEDKSQHQNQLKESSRSAHIWS